MLKGVNVKCCKNRAAKLREYLHEMKMEAALLFPSPRQGQPPAVIREHQE